MSGRVRALVRKKCAYRPRARPACRVGGTVAGARGGRGGHGDAGGHVQPAGHRRAVQGHHGQVGHRGRARQQRRRDEHIRAPRRVYGSMQFFSRPPGFRAQPPRRLRSRVSSRSLIFESRGALCSTFLGCSERCLLHGRIQTVQLPRSSSRSALPCLSLSIPRSLFFHLTDEASALRA